MKALLADTGPLYAAALPSDQYHERAQRDVQRIREDALAVIVPYPVLMETYSLLLRRTRPHTAQSWLEPFTERVGLISPTAEDYARAVTLVARYPDQRISLFDALVAVLAEQLNLPVWTFDSDFDVLRTKVWR